MAKVTKKDRTEAMEARKEARAITRMLRTSPIKLNQVAGQIRGLPVSQALTQLAFSPRRIAKDVHKTLQSAIANAENNHNLNIDDLVVSEAYVGKNMVLKRISPRARGRAARILKPYSEITVVVKEVQEQA